MLSTATLFFLVELIANKVHSAASSATFNYE